MKKVGKTCKIFHEIKIQNGEYCCELCGYKKSGLAKKTCTNFSKLYSHANHVHKDHPDYVPFAFCLLTKKFEKNHFQTTKKEEEFFQSDLWKKVKRLCGMQNKSDEKEFVEKWNENEKLGMQINKLQEICKSVGVQVNEGILNSFFQDSGVQTDAVRTESKETQSGSLKESFMEYVNSNTENKKTVDFFQKVLDKDPVQLLWNSIMLQSGSKKQRFNVFSRVGASYSRGFLNQKEGNEYVAIKRLLEVEKEVLKLYCLVFGAVDNCDVKLPYAFKNKHYHAMMQRVIYLINTEELPKNLNLTHLLSGNWRTAISLNKVTEICDEITELTINEIESIKSYFEEYVEAIISGKLDKVEPFIKKNTNKSLFIDKTKLTNIDELCVEFKKFLINSRVISRTVMDHRCATHSEFKKGFDSLKDMLGPKASMICLADFPGHQGTRSNAITSTKNAAGPGCLVLMHQHKYFLSSAVTASYPLGFDSFQKKDWFKLSRDTKKVPQGYLKKVQFANNNYFCVILIILLNKYCIETSTNYETVSVSNFVFSMWNHKHENDLFKNNILDKEIWNDLCDLMCSVLVVPILFKKSIHEKNWDLFQLSRKIGIPLLFRAKHPKYMSGLTEGYLDFNHMWSKDLLDVYKSCFLLKNGFNKYNTYDENYERSNGVQKEGQSTDPRASLLSTSKMSNITRFLKYIESEDVLYGQENLIPGLELQKLAKVHAEELELKLYSNLKVYPISHLRNLPPGSTMKGYNNNCVFFCSSETNGKIVNIGIKPNSDKTKKECYDFIKNIVKKNAK